MESSRIVTRMEGDERKLNFGREDVTQAYKKSHEIEKAELQELNSKLTIYLKHVKELEDSNERLREQIQKVRESRCFLSLENHGKKREELTSLRNSIDEAVAQKIRSESTLKRLENEKFFLQGKIDFNRLLSDLHKEKAKYLTNLNNSLVTQNEEMENRLLDEDARLERLKTEFDNYFEQLRKAKNDLFDKYEKVNLSQSQLQTLEDELEFLRAIHEEEIENFKSSFYTLPDDVNFYKMELLRSINQIRKDFDNLSREQIREYENLFIAKTEVLKEKVLEENKREKEAFESDSSTTNKKKLDDIANALDSVKSDYAQLKTENTNMEAELKAYEDEYLELKKIFDEFTVSKSNEINEINAEINALNEAIASIIENNVTMRFEINTYRRLIEGEEFHIKQSGGLVYENESLVTDRSSIDKEYASQRTDVKRRSSHKRNSIHSTHHGDVVIESLDPNGQFIILYNSSPEHTVDIGEWCIAQGPVGKPTEYFYFPQNTFIKPNSRFVIYSRNATISLDGFDYIKAENVEGWLLDGTVETLLLGADGNEQSTVVEE